jgi:hypothetical protein
MGLIFYKLYYCLNSNRDVTIMEEIFNELAPIHRSVKFVKIRATQASHNWPDNNCPAILLYRNGDLQKTWVTSLPFGGKLMCRKTVEAELAKYG